MTFGDLISIDWSHVRLRRAAFGVVAMLIAVAIIGVVGDVALTVVIAVLFVTASGRSEEWSYRWKSMARFTLYGSIIGGLSFWSIESALGVAVVLGIATYIGTLAAVEGPEAGKAGLFLTLWALFAIMLGSSSTPAIAVMIAYAVGGALAIAVTGVRWYFRQTDRSTTPPESGGGPDSSEDRPGVVRWVADAATGPVGQFAIVRTVGVIVGALLGAWWFPSYPLWVAITVIVVVRPSAADAMTVAAERTLGTVLGVLLAVAVASVLTTNDTGVLLAFVLSAFFMMAFNNANYTLFAMFLTAMLVLGQRLVQADAFDAGMDRLLATFAGGVLSMALVLIAEQLWAFNADQAQ
ncbi:MAG: FUSC family protein [Acidimicrobiia bacterium]